MTGLAIVANCPVHRVRPDRGCRTCLTAIDVNSMNEGWGIRRRRQADGTLVEWMTYQPFFSWFGPKVFVTELA